ncbi:MAG: hypothetical protein RIR51_1028 [Bacteroidota bacterium]
MKSINFLLFGILFPFFCFSQSNSPFGLTVENIRMPKNAMINDSNPEFGWLVPNDIPEQKAYQILVSSTIKGIKNYNGDRWDSGMVNSSESADISYSGNDLVPNKEYYWRLRIWDEKGNSSPYSEIQSFKITGRKDLISSTNIFQVERIPPKIKKVIENNIQFFDFGKAAFGTIQLVYNAKEDGEILIRLGEQLKDGKINLHPGGNIRTKEIFLSVKKGKNSYQLKIQPDERNTRSMAVRMPEEFPIILPFRYCEIEGAEPIRKEDIFQEAYFSYFEENQSDFFSSDTVLNQVWEICKYTMKASSFSGYYLDGDRERIPYEADAYINQLSHFSTDREYMIARKTLEYFMDNPTWPTEWQLHVAMMFYQDYLYTGNSELIEKYYQDLKYKTLMDLRREDGLISVYSVNNTPEFRAKLGFKDPKASIRDIVDWPPGNKSRNGKELDLNIDGERDGYEFTEINTVVNAFFYHNMEIMREFAKLLENKSDEKLFEEIAKKVKESINSKLYDEENQRYVDGEGTDHASLHANMMVLAFDIVPEERKKAVVDFIKTRGMACSVYGSQYLLEGLYKANEPDYALELMTAKHDRSWWNMIAVGSTMTLEAWDEKYKPNLDWNHAWGAAPANIIVRHMWGIQPMIPGGRMMKIKPQMGNLQNVKILAPTIHGGIEGVYKNLGEGQLSFDFSIPGNVEAKLFLLQLHPKKIVLNGKEIENNNWNNLVMKSGKHQLKVFVNP